MLVLSRKTGQRIAIGEGITIVVNRVLGNRVVIGIEAPQDVNVRRGELKACVTGVSRHQRTP
jgi:carbon storage regulator